MNQRKYFGTDGIRGCVGKSNINPEFFLKLGWAFGRVLVNGNRKMVVIGKDTRVSGYMLESALEAGLAAAGVDVKLLGPMPTPAVAYLTQTLRATAGIVISASHNPFEDNGVKFFSATGMKLPDSIEHEIEAEVEKALYTVAANNLGKASRVSDAPGRYIEFCKSSIPSMTRLSGLKIVVDCANGATYHIAPNVFKELGAQVITLNDEPDGFNINQHCGSTKPELLQEQVLHHGADLGVALDGDGDRCILVDAAGNIVNGDQIIYIIARDRHEKGLLQGGVVGTLMSNFGLEKALNTLGISFARSQVGDRYVLDMLTKNNWKIGGEPSGHVVCLDKTTTGDGIIAALQVMTCMVQQQASLQELCADISLMPQQLVNVKSKTNPRELALNQEVLQAVKSSEHELQNDGRVLLRPSGTEPLLRIMVEGRDTKKVQHHVRALADRVKQIDESLQPAEQREA